MDQPLSPQINEITVQNQAAQPASNLYPFFRKLFFVLVILFFLVVLLFLVYQNGKSIYDNGL